LLGIGFAVAARNIAVAIVVVIYLSVTLTAAVRIEEATLDEKFEGAYSHYRAGTIAPLHRAFSWRRVAANREYRAVAGLAAAFLLLFWRTRL
jgi:hypothetical protein